MTIEELLEIAEATGDWEKLARTLLAKRKPKKAKTQDVYAWALAEFSDGVRIVVGGYGLKDEKIILQKAQLRRALVMSGRWLDAAVLAATAPPVRGYLLADTEVEPARLMCLAQRVKGWGAAAWETAPEPETTLAREAREAKKHWERAR